MFAIPIYLLLLLAPAFSPVHFILFFVSGALLALIVFGTLQLFLPNSKRLIPLAGILGVCLSILCMVELFSDGLFRMSNDCFVDFVFSTYM